MPAKRFCRLAGRFRKRMCVGFAAEVLGANYRRFSLTGVSLFSCPEGGGFILHGKGEWQGERVCGETAADREVPEQALH
ncbi:hypothetical protein LG52_2721 [Geobacillus kaustophilus]|uniref:Uncharacterized protein n=1 Tax=Geobacillus kaustophilus TaxID=1462 RepID=A0A0D8BQ09_GEOKU|nr:hypothetical protein LG52_2721 [Geobacillus kaustophilus]